MDVSRSVSASTASRSAAGILANAELTGAKIVNGPAPLSVSTRPAAVDRGDERRQLRVVAGGGGGRVVGHAVEAALAVGGQRWRRRGRSAPSSSPSSVRHRLGVHRLGRHRLGRHRLGRWRSAAGAGGRLSASSSSPPQAAATRVRAATAARAAYGAGTASPHREGSFRGVFTRRCGRSRRRSRRSGGVRKHRRGLVRRAPRSGLRRRCRWPAR